MSKRKKSSITMRALMRLYKVELEENLNGSYTGKLPWSVCPDSELVLHISSDIWWLKGGGLSAYETTQTMGERLEFIMHIECVSRERASEMLYNVYPAVLKRERITTGGLDYATHTKH